MIGSEGMIRIKSPTRVDLAGGTLDLWPLYNFIGPARTVNVAIDIYTEVNLSPRSDGRIEIESLDLKKTWTFENLEVFLASLDASLQLFQSVLRFFHRECPTGRTSGSGFSLKTSSESPIGGGLGGSSSLIISLLKAFSQFYDFKFSDTHALVSVAHNLEAQILLTPTGTQDYYPAAVGGLNTLEYSASGIKHKTISIEKSEIFDHFLLVYTGRSHHSGLNNFEVMKACVERDPKVLDALKKINVIAHQLSDAISKSDYAVIPQLLQQEYDERIRLTPAFTSDEIERLAKIAKSNGADAIKICGAGGGGCVLIWVHPQHRQKVINACENENFQCLPARPVNPI